MLEAMRIISFQPSRSCRHCRCRLNDISSPLFPWIPVLVCLLYLTPLPNHLPTWHLQIRFLTAYLSQWSLLGKKKISIPQYDKQDLQFGYILHVHLQLPSFSFSPFLLLYTHPEQILHELPITSQAHAIAAALHAKPHRGQALQSTSSMLPFFPLYPSQGSTKGKSVEVVPWNSSLWVIAFLYGEGIFFSVVCSTANYKSILKIHLVMIQTFHGALTFLKEHS